MKSKLAFLLIFAAAPFVGCTGIPPTWGFADRETNSPSEGPDRIASETFAGLMTQGSSQEQSGDWGAARRIYDQVTSNFPDRAEGYHRLGVVADQQRRYRDAQEFYTQAVQRDPANAQFFNDLGYCFLLQEELDKAESALLKAVRLDESNDRFQNNLGLVYGSQERYDDALDTFRNAGSEADAQCNLAYIYSRQGEMEKAQHCIEAAYAANPGHEVAARAIRAYRQRANDSEVAQVQFVEPVDSTLVPYVEGVDVETPTGESLPPNRHSFEATRALHLQAHATVHDRVSQRETE